MLDRGEDDDWFYSNFIRTFAVLTLVGIIGAIYWLMYARKPVVDLHCMKDRNFAISSLLMAGMAMILYGSSVVIPQLAQHFLKRYPERNRKTVKGFTPQAMDLLIHYPWPGNIRELENAVERAVVLLTGNYISERELPLAIAGTPLPSGGSEEGGIQPLVEVEKEVILAALEKTGGNKTEAARQLGITRKTLLAKLSR